MQITISSIQIRKRIRKETGDLESLMESFRKHGQLNPILISPNLRLIAGYRRLESARRLGWTTIDAKIIKNFSKITLLEMELDENIQRKPLANNELSLAISQLEKLKTFNPILSLLRLIMKAFLHFFNRLIK